jgi:hypothetical protein
VGASSGGLDSFAQLLRPMPVDSGLAFVLIQHLERTHPSALAEIVGRATLLPVMEAKDGTLAALHDLQEPLRMVALTRNCWTKSLIRWWTKK